VPEGLLGFEWDIGLLPASYRGQVNHGDRIAVLGRWILDQGHDFDGFYRTEIHPPLLVASAAVVQPPDRSARRTRVLFMSRPFLSGQTYTNNVATRYVDGVDDDGPLYPHSKSELINVVTGQSTMVEMHPKIKSKPFRGSHRAQFVVRPPAPPPASGGELVVSFRFTVRTPCSVAVGPLGSDAVLVTVDIRERAADREYQSPDLPPHHEETYSTDDLNLLSSGSGDRIESVRRLISALVAFFVSLGLGVYIWLILGRGIKTDIFDPLPDIDVLDPTNGVSDVSVQHIPPGAGVVTDNNQDYPIRGWLEAHWATPIA
jgi:hypothetical protein